MNEKEIVKWQYFELHLKLRQRLPPLKSGTHIQWGHQNASLTRKINVKLLNLTSQPVYGTFTDDDSLYTSVK